jgi:hypothetical protein
MPVSLGKKVLEAPASIIDSFLSRDICGFSTELNMHIWNKMSFNHLEPSLLDSIPFKN